MTLLLTVLTSSRAMSLLLSRLGCPLSLKTPNMGNPGVQLSVPAVDMLDASLHNTALNLLSISGGSMSHHTEEDRAVAETRERINSIHRRR